MNDFIQATATDSTARDDGGRQPAPPVLLLGFPAMPDARLAEIFHLVEPLWKSGDITVWRAGRSFKDLESDLARGIDDGTVWSASFRTPAAASTDKRVVTKWPGSLVLDSRSRHIPDDELWERASSTKGVGSHPRLLVLRPKPNKPNEPLLGRLHAAAGTPEGPFSPR